ncbi:MAG TPA: hypothetical protein VHN14_28185 [Kofleriaceae bacterium]|jgi:hypothetical protein|nr:hypothetical protein [Kofleriaceae bacterium]
MPRGSKSAYTKKQKRQAHHIEASAKKRGYSDKRAAQIGYATVNKQDHGGKKSGGKKSGGKKSGGKKSGRVRGKKSTRSSGRAGGHTRPRSSGESRGAHARAGRAAHRKAGTARQARVDGQVIPAIVSPDPGELVHRNADTH